MNNKTRSFFWGLLFFAPAASAQQITLLTRGVPTSLRGLSVVDDHILWASGSNGSVAKSVDGGKTFTWYSVKGFEQRDFRDIEAFDASTAIIMAISEPAVLLKTTDGGISWKEIFTDTSKGVFWMQWISIIQEKGSL